MRRERFSRRRFLAGAGGVTLGIPFLESLLGRGAAQPTDADRRFLVFFTCNGFDVSRFHPLTPVDARMTQEDFPEQVALHPLGPYADRLNILRGVNMTPRGFYEDPAPGCEHDKGMGSKLTAQPLDPVTFFPLGESVDQLIARRLNPGGRAPLNLMVGPQVTRVNGIISSRGANDPVVAENNPLSAYERITGLYENDAARDALYARRQSVLDLVGDDLRELRALVSSPRDQAKLETHFESVRQLELDLEAAGLCGGDTELRFLLEAMDPERIGSDANYKLVGQLQMDVIALALRCPGQRVVTLQWGNGAMGPIFRWDGMSHAYNHHKVSHANTMDDGSGERVEGAIDMMHDIDRWYAERFAEMLVRLDATTEGAHGSVLDQSAVLWINELSDGSIHDYRDLPVVLAGSAGGRFDTGWYRKMNPLDDYKNVHPNASHDRLLNTLINVTTMSGPEDTRVTDFGWDMAPGGEMRVLESDWA
ncbi:MAG: DUF1552 domain-containing protein [Myxococcota bacterium]